MDELTEAVSNLSLCIKEEKQSPDLQKILNIISKMLITEVPDPNKEMYVEILLANDVVEVFMKILKVRRKYAGSVISTVVELVAELAKTESGRKQSTDTSLISIILDLLSSKDYQLATQACRALANISFDNDKARNIVKEKNGIEKLIHLLKSLLEKQNFPENLSARIAGCFVNLTDSCDELLDKAFQAGVLDVLMQYLSKFSSDHEVVTNCVFLLSCVAESEKGCEKLLDDQVLPSLLNFLDGPVHDDVLDSLLDLMRILCENGDCAKQKLAEMGLCEKLVKIIRKYAEDENKVCDENPNIYKVAPDIVVLMLTGDTCMEYLYKEGQGLVFKETRAWLNFKNENLQIDGALAVGNFARKDSHCIQMVNGGVAEELLNLLDRHSGKDGDIRLQHAVLSALKNLAIPAENKMTMVKIGTVDKLLKMMDVETYPVVFKLLGTLRMLLRGQEEISIMIGECIPFIQRVVEWSSTEDHPGVKGEATRLLAWLIGNTMNQPEAIINNLIDCGAMPPLISMLASEHLVMQEEALKAIAIVINANLDDSEKFLLSSIDVINNQINFILSNNTGNRQEMVYTALLILKISVAKEKLKSVLKCSTFLPYIHGLAKDSTGGEIQDLAGDLLLELDEC